MSRRARHPVGAMRAGRYSSPMTVTPPAWVPAGKAFDADDFVYFHDKGRRPVEDVLGEIDLILTGPHASAAFPEEMAPFVDDRLTCRLQHDFTDISTSPVGRRWAEIDPARPLRREPAPTCSPRREPGPSRRSRCRTAGSLRAAATCRRDRTAIADRRRCHPTSDVRVPARAPRATRPTTGGTS